MVCRHSQKSDNRPIRLIDTAARHRNVFQLSVGPRLFSALPGLFRQLTEIVTELRRGDILAIHLTTSGQLGLVRDCLFLLTSYLFQVHRVLHIRIGRTPQILENGGIESRLLRLAMRLSSTVIAIDSQTYYAIQAKSPKTKLSLIPNCIDFSHLPSLPEHKNRTVVFVGWVLKAKGIEDLLNAWQRIDHADWTLKIVGPYDSQYLELLQNNFDLSAVVFMGECSNAAALQEISKASIFCLPSHTEGFPNVVLEAMALGSAIVATSVGAIPEMLSEGSGRIVAAGDVDTFAIELYTLIKDSAMRGSLGAKASERAKREYSLEHIYREYEKIWADGEP